MAALDFELFRNGSRRGQICNSPHQSLSRYSKRIRDEQLRERGGANNAPILGDSSKWRRGALRSVWWQVRSHPPLLVANSSLFEKVRRSLQGAPRRRQQLDRPDSNRHPAALRNRAASFVMLSSRSVAGRVALNAICLHLTQRASSKQIRRTCRGSARPKSIHVKRGDNHEHVRRALLSDGNGRAQGV
ncbi:hypothetical protein GGE24_007436 [Bradyrhizobium centrosematis]|nr:hypothetical protein [Bradyrhizobium centrosematis]MCS3778061.1 hypothetical protein [Bradyrhizobium centrosematis]